jgi:hypothetical protein
MDNSNLREEQKKVIRDALALTAAAHRYAERGQITEAKDVIAEVIACLKSLATYK